MERIIVCGGRDYTDIEKVNIILTKVWNKHKNATLVEGGARGADRLAQNWARQNSVPVETIPADWDRWGRSAGYRRNSEMANLDNVIGVVAFPGGKGTQHMIDTAQERGIKVLKVT